MYELRPLSGGEILDGAFAIYRRHFGVFLGISVLGYGAGTVVNTYVTIAGGALEMLGLAAVGWLLSAVGGLLAAGATVWVISESYLGREPVLGHSLRYALTRMVALFIAGLGKYLLIFLSMFLLIVPAVIVACGYAVVAQVVVLEELSAPTDALGRSWSLTKGFKRKAFGLGIVVLLLVYLPAIVGGALAPLAPSADDWIIAAFSVLSVVVYPLVSCTFTLFYYDLRVRKEAFDLEVLSRQLSGAAT